MPWLVHPPALGDLGKDTVPSRIQEHAEVFRTVGRVLDDVQRTREQTRAEG